MSYVLKTWEFLPWPQAVVQGKLIGKIQTMASMTTSEMLGTHKTVGLASGSSWCWWCGDRTCAS